MRVKTLLFLLLLFFRCDLLAQEFVFKNITREQGLQGGEVYHLIQDSKGYIWGITDGGVFKYNGSSFKHFSGQDGLPGYSFFTLVEDKKGKVWTSSFNGRVGYFVDDKYHEISCNDSLSEFLKFGNRLVYNLYVDDGDTLWLGTLRNLIKIPPAQNYAVFLPQTQYPDSVSRIVKQFSDNHVMSSTHARLDYDNPQKQKKAAPDYHILFDLKNKREIIKTRTDQLIIAGPNIREVTLTDGRILFSYYNQVYCLNVDGSLERFVFDKQVIKIIQDRLNNIWICFSRGGTWKYDKSDLKSVPEKHLSQLSVSSLMVDRENGLWVCTLENGIYYSPSLNSRIFLNNADPDNKIIGLATSDSGVMAVTRNQKILMIYNNTVELKRDFSSQFIGERTLLKQHNGKLYVTGLISGFTDLSLKKFTPFSQTDKPMQALDITFKSDDTAYVTTFTDVYVYYKDKSVDTIPLSFRGRNILAAGDRLLLGSLTGLFEIKGRDIVFLGAGDERLTSRVNYMIRDRLNRIWICTKGEGVLYSDGENWKQLNTTKNLSSNLCNYIVEANDSVFYIATDKGIDVIHAGKDSIRVIGNYNEGNGLPGNEVFCLAFDGLYLWAGTGYGLVKINTGEAFVNSVEPPVYVYKILLNDSVDVTYSVKKVFNFDQNNLSFFADVLSYKTVAKQKLMYELYLDKKLLSSKEEHKNITLQNLVPGNYELKIYGYNNSSIAGKPVIYQFTIAKPYWLQWWFLTSVFVLLITVIVLILRWRINRNKRKQFAEIELERKIAAYRLQALHAQMNPHFIFNAINSIQSSILQKKQHEAYQHLTKFSQLIRQVLLNTHEQLITVAKEIDALKLYIEIEQLRFEDSFEFEITVNPALAIDNIYMPSMIIQPFVENAIWHGLMPLNGIRKARLSVYISQSDEKIFVEVRDNGIGRKRSGEIKKNVNHRSLGISLTQERLELMAKTGSRMEINDIMDDDKQVCGTAVQIWI